MPSDLDLGDHMLRIRREGTGYVATVYPIAGWDPIPEFDCTIPVLDPEVHETSCVCTPDMAWMAAARWIRERKGR